MSHAAPLNAGVRRPLIVLIIPPIFWIIMMVCIGCFHNIAYSESHIGLIRVFVVINVLSTFWPLKYVIIQVFWIFAGLDLFSFCPGNNSFCLSVNVIPSHSKRADEQVDDREEGRSKDNSPPKVIAINNEDKEVRQ